MILFLHHRYRTTGGEERVVDDLMALVREHLGEDVQALTRDSTTIGAGRAALGLLRGGLEPGEVAKAVRLTHARVVHAHNLNPTYGPRALEAARRAGARTVLHLHNYRLVCAVATCFNAHGEDCTRCHGRDTTPGVRLNCRGSRAEAVPYAIALSAYQRRLVAAADVVIVPSEAALRRLRELGAPLEGADVRVMGHVVHDFAERSTAADGRYALVASRLAPEKGVDAAIDACAQANVPLVIAGDGPLAATLRTHAERRGGDVRFAGRVGREDLAQLRAGAALELFATHAAETFGLSAVEAMAAGVPVVATPRGALADLAPEAVLTEPGAPMADAVTTTYGDAARGARSIARARALADPSAVAQRLRDIYG